jgi:hypothetical protein
LTINVLTFHGFIISRHPKSGKARESRHFVWRTIRLRDMAPIQRRTLFAIQAISLQESLHQHPRKEPTHSYFPSK